MKEEYFKEGNDYLQFRLKGYTIIVLRIDSTETRIEIRKGKKDKLLFSEKVKGGLIK
jgi:hypothetical protein